MIKKLRKKHRRQSYTVGEFGPRPVDVHVGGRVKARRTLIGMNQEELGNHVGLTFQQIQKYEKGMNRMGASRLWQFSLILGQPISWFFEEWQAEAESRRPPGETRDTEIRPIFFGV